MEDVQVFAAFAQDLVGATWAAIIPSSLIEYDATSWAHPSLWEMLVHNHFQIFHGC